jgi:putative oxidoreductase
MNGWNDVVCSMSRAVAEREHSQRHQCLRERTHIPDTSQGFAMTSVSAGTPAAQPRSTIWRSTFPFVDLSTTLLLLRIGIPALFMAHATVRLLPPGTVTGFGAFLERAGFSHGVLLVWAITAFELVGGTLMIFGKFTRYLAAGFIALLLAGIGIIHYKLGWFVGEHGSGGSEYSVALILALIVIAAADTSGRTRSD